MTLVLTFAYYRDKKMLFNGMCLEDMLGFHLIYLKIKFYSGVHQMPVLTAAGWADVHDRQGRIVYVTAPPPHSVIFVLWCKDTAPTAGAQRVISGTETNW